MSEGSVQLKRYLQARRDGMTMTTAAVFAPMSITEARLTEADMAAGRLDHIINEMPSPSIQPATEAAPAPAIQRESVNGVRGHRADIAAPMDGPASPPAKENTMPRPKKADAEKVEIVQKPDFEKMKRIFLGDIKPAEEKNAKARGDLSAAWKAIEDDCHLNKKAAKLLHKLHGESEETRDDFLRTLYGGMKALNLGISQDLVDQMDGAEAPTMPVKGGKGLGLDGLATAH